MTRAAEERTGGGHVPTFIDAADPPSAPSDPSDAGGTAAPASRPGPVPLLAPRDGVPDVVDTMPALADAIAALRAGHGPVAVDAERASGHRYGQRAFLVQLRRACTGTVLIDPAALPDLSAVGDALAGVLWVLHAASQDLPCLAEVGMHPGEIFDTELAGRLAGYPRVGLAAMVEELLGLSLAKEHSAVDWSTRPLPQPWLRYAALDVEVLLDLRDAVAAALEEQGKTEWARQEFGAVAAATPPAARVDPWRRTSGVHRLRTRRQLAAVRELWQERDAIAFDRDVSPGRILPDAAIIEAAASGARTAASLAQLHGFTGRGAQRYGRRWADALRRAHFVDEAELPVQHLPSEGPPPPRTWRDRDPDAAARLAACRAALTLISREQAVPAENLLSPDTVRRLAWHSPPASVEELRAQLVAAGARPWQVDLTAAPLSAALRSAALRSASLRSAARLSAQVAAQASSHPAEPEGGRGPGQGHAAGHPAGHPPGNPAGRSPGQVSGRPPGHTPPER